MYIFDIKRYAINDRLAASRRIPRLAGARLRLHRLLQRHDHPVAERNHRPHRERGVLGATKGNPYQKHALLLPEDADDDQ